MGLEKSFRGKCSSSAVFFLTSVICFPHLASCIYFLALGSRYIFPARIRYLFPALCIRYQFPAFGDCYLFPALCIRYPFPTLGNSYSFLALGTRYLFPAFGTHFGRRPLVEWGTRGKSSLSPPPRLSLPFPRYFFPKQRACSQATAWQDVYASARSCCFISQAERLLDEAVQKYPDFAKVRVTNNFE